MCRGDDYCVPGVKDVLGISIASYVAGLLATIFYCALVWYGGNFFGYLSGVDEGNPVSAFSRLAIQPLDLPMTYNMLHWQLIASGSFVISSYLAVKNRKQDDRGALPSLPIVNHFGLLLLMLLINVVGFVSPMLAVGYVIE